MKKLIVIAIIGLFLSVAVAPSINADEVNRVEKTSEKITVFYSECIIEVYKSGYNGFGRRVMHSHRPEYLYVDADLEELHIEIVMNYTAIMNYSLLIPYPIAPLFIFGMKIENYTEYQWESIKLGRIGYEKQEGNISLTIDIDMDQYEFGDIELIWPITVRLDQAELDHCHFNTPDNRSWRLLFRMINILPILNKLLLYDWLLPKLTPYNSNKVSSIWLYFE